MSSQLSSKKKSWFRFSTGQLEEDSSPAFLVDGMLGTTARKLRILGFDTIYDPKSGDKELVRAALSSRRTLLTSDFELYVYAKSLKGNAILVKGKGEQERLYQVLAKSGVHAVRVDRLLSRCSVCNGELVDTGTEMLNESKVYYCRSCGKRYWRGSHWKKLSALFDAVNIMLTTNRSETA